MIVLHRFHTRSSRLRMPARNRAGAAALGLAAALSLLPAPPVRAEVAIRVGSELDYPPFALVAPDGRPEGFSVELFRAVAAVMNLDVSFRVGPWAEILTDLREGRLDALPFVGICPERAEYLDFSVPFITSHGAVFVRAEAADVATETDLGALQIAVMRDDIAHEYARRQAWAHGLVAAPSLEEAFRRLAAGEVDAVVAPRLQGMLVLEQLGRQAGDIVPASLSLDGFALRYAFAVRKGNDALLARLNGGLAIVMADGTFAALYERWLPSPANGGIPPETVLKIVAAGLLAFLLIASLMYWRQRRLAAVATARGTELETQTDQLRRLAARLEEEHQETERERTRAEEASAEAQALLQVIPDLMFRHDAEGRFVDCYDPGGAAFVSREQLLGRRIEEVLPAPAAAVSAAALRRARVTGAVQTVEYALPVPAGRDGTAERTYEAKVAPMPDGGALSIVRDVSEARAREARLVRAAQVVAAASAAKTRFLATMSHELRTPLNAIIGFSEILTEELFGPLGSERYRGYARDIHNSGRSLLTLINDVLDITKIEAGKLTLKEEPVDLKALVEHKACMLRAMATVNGTVIRLDLPAGPVAILADDVQVQRMALNLLANAVKFTQNGTVTVSLDDRTDAVRLTVADTGVGMSRDQLAHLGEPFYQAHSDVAKPGNGTGLGVALVKEMIALHGGELHFESEPGRGTTVHLIFPPERRIVPPGGQEQHTPKSVAM